MSDIFLEVNGFQYKGFTDIEVSRSIENFAGKFKFSTTVKENSSLVVQNDLKVQDEVRVFIDSDLILTGYIEELNISYSVDSHSISVSGRDKTGDLIDSSIKQAQYKQINFIKLAEAVLLDNGYTDIKIINNLTTPPILTTGETATDPSFLEDGESPTAEQGASIVQFLDSYAKKLQVLLVTDEDGNINVTSEGDQLADGALISTKTQSNILAASINVSTVDRFRFIEVYSQGDNSSFYEQSSDQSSIVTDTSIRSPRRKRIPVNTASKTTTLDNLAKWNVSIREAKGLRYNCTVQGFYTTRKNISPWLPNTLVQLKDERCQVDGQFLIQGVTYRRSLRGSFTDLSIVKRGAFSVESPVVADNSDFGGDLIDILS